MTELNGPHWLGAAEGRFLLQKCLDCGWVRYPISPLCAACASARTEWTDLPGTGTVWSYVVSERAFVEGLGLDVPYAVALVELDDGPRYLANIVGCPAGEVHIGMRVDPSYEPLPSGHVVVRFRPQGAEVPR